MDKKKKEKFDPDKYYKENIEPYLKSKGVQKVWNYFLEITRTEYFQNFIKETREKYSIPPGGFKPKNDKYHLIPPEGFNKSTQAELRDEIIEKICKRYELHYFDYADVIEPYIYYDKFLNPLDSIGACGLFRVSDVIEEKEEPFSELFQKSDDMAYPIAIRISPYASQRDLVDFIKNKVVWKNEIQLSQNKYRKAGINIGKIKSRKEEIQKRNDFIYKNRHLPRKEIMKMVAYKFGYDAVIDYGLVGKIISIETKRRKDVSS